MIVVLGSSEPLEPVTKRATYAEGIGAKSFKNSSVKKLMIIGCMGDTAESYPTIKKMMGEVGVTGPGGGGPGPEIPGLDSAVLSAIFVSAE